MIVTNTRMKPAYRITVFNQDATSGRPVGAYMSAQFGWRWRVPGVGTLVLKASHPLAARLMQCKRNVVPIRAVYQGKVWDGRVMRCSVSGEPGNEIVTATCVGNLLWLSTFLAWVNPLLPVDFQVALTGKQDVEAGSVDYVLKVFLAKAAARMQKPVHVAIPVKYSSPLPKLEKVRNLDELLDLILGGGSDLCALQARFTQLDELFDEAITNSGRGMSMRLWTPSDGDAPTVFTAGNLGQLGTAIALATANNDFLSLTTGKLKKPGYVFDTHEKRDRRHMQWRTDNGSIQSYTRTVGHPTAHSVVVGGKAPEFMNDIVEWGANLAIKTLLNWLLPGLGLGDILIGDLLDDILFAYQQFNNHDLALDLGPHGFGETFGDNTTAWSLDAEATATKTLREKGPQESLQINVVSGTPGAFSFGADDGSGRRFDLGDIMTFWDKGTIVEDYVSGVDVIDSATERCVERVTFGDDRIVEDGWSQVIGHLKNLGAFTRAVANGTN